MADVTTAPLPTETQPNPRPAPREVRRPRFGLGGVFLALVLVYLLVPLGATLVFGLTSGGNTGLKEIPSAFSDPDFARTLTLSLQLALVSTLLTIALITPTAYWIEVRLPQARPVMEFLALIPFAVPAIVMAFGLLEVYGTPNPLTSILSFGLVPVLSNEPFNIIYTPPLLICGYVIIALPFVYRPIDNSLRAINTRVLMEAASSLGSGWWRTFLTIILPNILPGVLSAALLTFSTVMGEFTLASLFNIFTFPIFLNATGQSDPQKAAILTILSFLITLACGLGILLLVQLRADRTGNAADLNLGAAK